jgi:Na+/proline symporter
VALSILDWAILIVFLTAIVWIGLSYRKQSAKGLTEFFLGGRNLPWYLAGLSMVATTFAADTPLAVTEIVGNNGISGNWLWWNLLAGGMLTTFFFANLWRRANIVTEVEFIELRYSGKPAAFLRGFKALYLGLFMNVLVIGWVNLAMITILQGFFGIDFAEAALYTGLLTLLVAIYASLSGLMGVVVTDAIQFIIAMTGSILLAVFVINSEQVGGIEQLKSSLPEGTLNFLPVLNAKSGTDIYALTGASFLAFFGFVWWASWYPGAEPGGGGYIAQRMMSTKNEKHAVGATLFFQVAHYCLRPWPWILVGLAAITVYSIPKNASPDLGSQIVWMQETGLDQNLLLMPYNEFDAAIQKDQKLTAYRERLQTIRAELTAERIDNSALDNAAIYTKDKRFGYVFAMRDFLPKGMMGLLLAAFFAAFMSTISTQLNWGASYMVNDGYKRFIKPQATEKELVAASRAATILIMIAGLGVTVVIESISGVWKFIMECGAGLGMVLILRWYWWRINAWVEIVATIAPFVAYALAKFAFPHMAFIPDWMSEFPYSFFFTVGFTTVAWIIAMLVTKPEPQSKLLSFYTLIKPDGFWGPIQKLASGEAPKSNLINLTVCWLSAVAFTYSFLFLIGKSLLHEWQEALLSAGAAGLSLAILLIFITRTRIFS